MSSIQSYIKQQNILYAPMPAVGTVVLNEFVRDPYYASNPASEYGHFNRVFVNVNGNRQDSAISHSSLTVFRDMGQPIVSAGRTFRRIQQLFPKLPYDAGQATQPNTFGVAGEPATGAVVTDYKTYYYEDSIESGGCEFTNMLFRIR